MLSTKPLSVAEEGKCSPSHKMGLTSGQLALVDF